MKKNTKILLVVVAIIIVILIYVKPWQKEGQIDENLKVGTKDKKTGLIRLGNDAVLKVGTKSAEVQWIQYYYNTKIASRIGKTKLSEDGIFGSKTLEVVKSVTGSSTTTWGTFKYKVDIANNPALAVNNDPTEELPWIKL